MKQQVQTLNDGQLAKRYQWRGNKKQRLAMELWTDPASKTFGNAYQSFLKAGFSPSYAKNVMNITPKWLSEYIDRLDFQPEHIKQGIQSLAVKSNNSRSPDDTRLKAYEILAKISGMIDNKGTTVNIVQPILNGESVKRKVINQDSKDSTVSIDSD